jgi:DNA-binding HxlR family transcriptional regulator
MGARADSGRNRDARSAPERVGTAHGVVAAQSAVAVLGDVWTLRILRTIFRGKRRYRDFVEEFGVSRAVLTKRLGKLVEHGVLVRDVSHGGHPQYRLSASGLDLWSLFLAMWLWEHDWGAARDPDTWAPDRPRGAVLHVGCGQVMRPQLQCMACHGVVLPSETALPSAGLPRVGAMRSAPARASTSAFRRPRAATGAQVHSAMRLTRVLGDRWNSVVVGEAFRGTRQFSRFQSELGIGPAQLSDRLAELLDLGILQAQSYAGSRQEYRLTEAGIALFPITLELIRWGSQWLVPPEQALLLEHRPCGQTLAARWHCDQCRQQLSRETVRFA